jgi:hypothetical protein
LPIAQVPVVEMVKAATPTAGGFLEVCAVFVAMVGSWFHGVGGFGGSIELAEMPTNPIDITQPYLSDRIGWLSIDYFIKPYVLLLFAFDCCFNGDDDGINSANSFG